jgi:hypothetical protein
MGLIGAVAPYREEPEPNRRRVCGELAVGALEAKETGTCEAQ